MQHAVAMLAVILLHRFRTVSQDPKVSGFRERPYFQNEFNLQHALPKENAVKEYSNSVMSSKGTLLCNDTENQVDDRKFSYCKDIPVRPKILSDDR